MLVSDLRSWNMHAFGPGILATSGRHLDSNPSHAPIYFFTDLGPHHRKQRKLLNPVFNVNHMRYMMPIFHGVTRQVLSESCVNEPHLLNILPLALWGSRFISRPWPTRDQPCSMVEQVGIRNCWASWSGIFLRYFRRWERRIPESGQAVDVSTLNA
jgi:hypothetical protein